MSCKDSTASLPGLSGGWLEFHELCMEKECHWVQTDGSRRCRKCANAPRASLQTWCQQKCQPGVSALKAVIVIAVKAAGVFFFSLSSRSSCRVAPPAAAIDKVTAETWRLLLLKEMFCSCNLGDVSACRDHEENSLVDGRMIFLIKIEGPQEVQRRRNFGVSATGQQVNKNFCPLFSWYICC